MVFVDKDGQPLDVGDKVEVWSLNDQGDKDWVAGTVEALKYEKTRRKERTSVVIKKYTTNKYASNYAVSFTKPDNIRKV